MIKNLIKQTFKILGQNKFFAFLNFFGISITLMIVTIVWMKTSVNFSANKTEPNLDKTLIAHRAKTLTKEKNVWTGNISFAMYNAYFKNMKTPKYTSVISDESWTIVYPNKTINYDVLYTDEYFWKISNIKFIAGRPFNKQEVENGDNVLVINQRIKESKFGSQKAIGKLIDFQGSKYKIIGVVENVSYTCIYSFAEAWAPYTPFKHKFSKAKQYPGSIQLLFYADTKSDLKLIKKEFKEIERKINLDYVQDSLKVFVFADNAFDKFYRGYGSNPEKYIETFDGLGKIIGIFLLIIILPILNLITINYTRIKERSEEIGIRKSFGGTRANLIKQLVFENILINIIGGIIGLILSFFVIHFYKVELFSSKNYFTKTDLPAELFNIPFNYSIFFITLAVCVVLGLLSGLIPAIKMSKTEPAKVLKGGAL